MSLMQQYRNSVRNRFISNQRIVVVGTTADYIETIRSRHSGRALFVTAPAERSAALEPRPYPQEELLSELKDFEKVYAALEAHLLQWQLKAAGVACFDCESLELAAHIARKLVLPFPSQKAVVTCRNKILSKQIWRSIGIPCPRGEIIRAPGEVPQAMARFQSSVIMKPLTGSGSELVFKCSDLREARLVFDTIRSRLASHPDERMYGHSKLGNIVFNSRQEVLMEQFIGGNEFSCDFIIEGNKLQIIRIAAKAPAIDQPIGTTLAYVVPGAVPTVLKSEQFRRQLFHAARALGLKHALCMVDFIVHRDTVYLLELTPRPGGDCLPTLILKSSGLDMLGLALNFAARRPIQIPGESSWEKLVGMRIFVESAGIVKRIDDSRLKRDNSVRTYNLKARPGYRVKLPPEDYDSRIVGHVIFKPHPNRSIASQCASIRSKLQIEIGSES